MATATCPHFADDGGGDGGKDGKKGKHGNDDD